MFMQKKYIKIIKYIQITCLFLIKNYDTITIMSKIKY